jgi:hypothetical protein
MPTRQLTLMCARCNELTPHNQEHPAHLVHGLLTLFTAGLYLPIWLLIAIGGASKPVCVKCGGPVKTAEYQEALSAEAVRGRKIVGLIIVGVGVALLVYAALVMAGVVE